MRGIEAAMRIYARVKQGAVVSEVLRSFADGTLASGDRTLAASLMYVLVRRMSLWERMREEFLLPSVSGFSPRVQDAVLVGIAGLGGLRTFAAPVLISSLIDWTKIKDYQGARVVNAVLSRALAEGDAFMDALEKENSLESRCMLNGIPLWAAQKWRKQYGKKLGERLISMSSGTGLLSLRLSPDAPRDMVERVRSCGFDVFESPLPDGIRIDGTPLPTLLPGYEEGSVTPQTESSVLAGCLAAEFEGTRLLDMCAGRCVKTCQIAQLRPDISVEGWDLSAGRIDAGRRELERLGLTDQVSLKSGDSTVLEPDMVPDAVLVDAPCSGSGTWRRHPEGKWRLRPMDLNSLASLQKSLLKRAFTLVKKGGKVVYSTCSLFAEENEQVVGAVLEECPFIEELPQGESCVAVENKKYGRVILPDDPWTDGFYTAVFTKK